MVKRHQKHDQFPIDPYSHHRLTVLLKICEIDCTSRIECFMLKIMRGGWVFRMFSYNQYYTSVVILIILL